MKLVNRSAPNPESFKNAALELHQGGWRLAAFTATDRRETAGCFRLESIWVQNGRVAHLCAPLEPASPSFPSLTPFLTEAYWYEREMHDLFGIEPEGHPDLRPLVVHEDWPVNVFPMRRDYHGPLPGRAPVAHAAPPERPGLVAIPVGPVHAGIIEPGHFRFSAVGEQVLALSPQFSYVHRGLEKAGEGRRLAEVLPLAERVCGVCTVSHSWSFCQAVESLTETVVPPRAEAIRIILAELERLHNHVGDIANICAGVGLSLGNSHGTYLREQLMRLNESLTGHRFLRGCIIPGGVSVDLSGEQMQKALCELERIVADAAELADDCLHQDIFRDRLTGTGVLAADTIRELGTVGVAARASGVLRDVRNDLPYGGYELTPYEAVLEKDGDVKARFMVRVHEIAVALAIIRDASSRLVSGPHVLPVGEPRPGGVAVGMTESARGENVHLIMVGEDGTVLRWFVRSASYTNWPAVALAVPGNIVPDFPLINKSFELCYACLDR